MGRTVLYAESGVELVKNGRDEHFLSVLAGGVGQYGLTIKLTPEELGMYREYGDYYIEKLGLDLCREPSKFQDRRVAAL